MQAHFCSSSLTPPPFWPWVHGLISLPTPPVFSQPLPPSIHHALLSSGVPGQFLAACQDPCVSIFVTCLVMARLICGVLGVTEEPPDSELVNLMLGGYLVGCPAPPFCSDPAPNPPPTVYHREHLCEQQAELDYLCGRHTDTQRSSRLVSVRDENRVALLAAAEGQWSPPQALGICRELLRALRGAVRSLQRRIWSHPSGLDHHIHQSQAVYVTQQSGHF